MASDAAGACRLRDRPAVTGWRAEAVAVCVPVRDERRRLPRLLAALARQTGVAHGALTLCLLFDNCTDGSEDVVDDAALPFPVRRGRLDGGGAPDAGRARRAAMALGVAATAGASSAALLTTDADSVPADDWVESALRALAVSDMVAGRIDLIGGAAAQERVARYLDRLHALRRRIDPVPWEAARTHHHSGGANLVFRADAYAAIGGFPECAAGEDAATIDAAHRLGLRVRRDAEVAVDTSARRHGRVAGGLADHLERIDRIGAAAVTLSHPDDDAWQYAGHAAARARFPVIAEPGAAEALAALIAGDAARIRRVAAGSANAEAFAIRIVPAAPTAGRVLTLAEAEAALDRLERGWQERAA